MTRCAGSISLPEPKRHPSGVLAVIGWGARVARLGVLGGKSFIYFNSIYPYNWGNVKVHLLSISLRAELFGALNVPLHVYIVLNVCACTLATKSSLP